MAEKEVKEKENFIKWFSELNKDSVDIVGGKGANLGEIYNLGVPVPPGFVITTEAYAYFLKESGLKKEISELLGDIDYDDTAKLNKNAKKIRELIISAQIPKDLIEEIEEAYENLDVGDANDEKEDVMKILEKTSEEPFVAVRSSATTEDLADASFAGQQDTFVNVKGKEELLEKVKKCFASLFTSRATYYRNKKGFEHEKSGLAVVIQKMVDSEKSGVIFSKDPSFNNENIIIEAVYGLGEGIVSGKITPDSYVVSKDFKILKKEISEKKIAILKSEEGKTEEVSLDEKKSKSPVLNEYELNKLSEIALRLEKHYNKPQDIEFAIEGEQVYIVQTRAITTIGSRVDKEDGGEIDGEIVLKGVGASPGVASGKIKIVKDLDELEKVKKGDVLVTKMTNPDMVVTMQKSSAIVTDEGGLTCFAGDTKVLTNKGFMDIREATRRVKENEKLFIFSYDCKNLKPIWKKIINAGSKKSEVVRVSVSQTGHMKENTIDITPDHKMFTFKNRNLVKKELNKVINDKEMLCLVDRLPKNETFTNYKLAYINGLLLADGHVKIDYYNGKNPRRGYVIFTQKQTEEKSEIIQTFKNYFQEVFGGGYSEREKVANSIIRGKTVQGTVTDFSHYSLKTALILQKISQNLAQWAMNLDEESCLNFLAGIIDGDGSFSNNRINIYISKQNILEGIIVACLKLGIFPQVTSNRNISNVQILERMNDILQFSKKIKIKAKEKKLGTKLFAAKQILGDIIEEVNYSGKINPYVKNNLLIDSRKILRDILPTAKPQTKKELIKILNSSIRMHRISSLDKFKETEVFNLEVEADNELDKNYIIFTKRYTPLLVSNSHAAIVSREMGIPAIVGTRQATTKLKEGETITVNGSSGKVYKGKVAETKKEEIKPVQSKTKTSLKVIVDLPSYAERAAKTGLKAVGLTRIEGIIAESNKHPNFFLKNNNEKEYEEIIYDGISKIAKQFDELWIRTSDIRSDEFSNLEGAPETKEANPMLGFHGIRFGLKNPKILKAELNALKRVSEEDKTIGLILPQVISVKDVQEVKKILKEIDFLDARIGVMVETPASVQIIDKLCEEGIDFISFGTNDLTQYTLAIDRGNERVQEIYEETNLAILRQIEHVIKVCKENGVETSICGQAGSKKEMVKFLVKKGIDSISVNADMASNISEFISGLEESLEENQDNLENKEANEEETREKKEGEMNNEIENEVNERDDNTREENENEEDRGDSIKEANEEGNKEREEGNEIEEQHENEEDVEDSQGNEEDKEFLDIF